jgi:xanthine dehydrogenase/oxidase
LFLFQEPTFPPELQIESKYDQQNLIFSTERVTWYRPTQLSQMLQLKSKFPSARIVVGNTEVGVEVKFKNCLYPVIIQPNNIKELTSIQVVADQGVKFGAAVTLSNLEATLREQIKSQGEAKTKIYKAIIEMLNWFAGKKIHSKKIKSFFLKPILNFQASRFEMWRLWVEIL